MCGQVRASLSGFVDEAGDVAQQVETTLRSGMSNLSIRCIGSGKEKRHFTTLSLSECADLSQRFSENGLSVTSAGLGHGKGAKTIGSGSDVVSFDSVGDLLKEHFEQSRAFGAKYVRVFGGNRTEDMLFGSIRDQVIDQIGWIAETAWNEFGLAVGVEHEPNTACALLSEAVDVVREIDKPYLGAIFDEANNFASVIGTPYFRHLIRKCYNKNKEQSMKKYNQELKSEVCDKLISGSSLKEVSESYGIAPSTISGWLKRTAQGQRGEELEIGRLRRENEALSKLLGRMCLEQELLKKKKSR